MIRRDFLSEVSRMTSNMYAALLDAKTVEERAAMFKKVDEMIWRLQNSPSVVDVMVIEKLLTLFVIRELVLTLTL